MKYGIIGAMPEEVAALREKITSPDTVTFGSHEYISGTLGGKDIVLTCSGIGKVSAGSAAAVLLSFFNCDIIINTGVGGGLNPALKTLDMVISSGAAQHDFDLTIFNYQKGQVPGFPRIIPADSNITAKAMSIARETGTAYGFAVYSGVIVSGDQFIAGKDGRKNIDENFPEAWVTEMEGAAIAQVAAEFRKPFLIIRSISDKANGEADMTFNEMLPLAARNSQEVLIRILENGL